MSDDTPKRQCDFRVNAAGDIGFCVWQAGEVVAALTSPAEVADWLERKLRELPGEREREERDFKAMQEANANVERMPLVARVRTADQQRGRFFGR